MDGTAKKFLTFFKHVLRPNALTHIFQLSFDNHVMPREWTQAYLTPIFNKGSNIDPANYRPVSLTSIAFNVIDRIIRDAISRYLIKNNLL